MIRINRLLFLPGLVFFCAVLIASPSREDEIHPSTKKGIYHLLRQEYETADSCWAQIPDTPRHKLEREFYPCMTAVNRYIDLNVSELTDDAFIGKLESVTELCRSRLVLDDNDLTARLYLGYSYAFMAMYYNFRRNLPSALAYGLKSVGELGKCIEIDSTFREPYIAVGSYKYWRSSLLRKLHIPFVADGRDEGISIVMKGIDSPLGDYLAWNQLAWIYIDYERYDEAVETADKTLERYPGNRIMLWVKAIAYREAKCHAKACEEFSLIQKSLEKDGYNDLDVYYRVLYMRAEAYFKNEQFREARTLCLDIFAIRSKPEINSKQKNILKRAEKLLAQCEDKM